MAVTAPTAIDDAFRKRFARSAELYTRSRSAIAGGITHDSRNFAPFPIYVERADGSRKWDVDGNELVDHWMGHGSLLLGHNHPQVTAAVAEQVHKGTHYGACHELEVAWAEQIQRLIPSAEWVRFTMSGTEATMLAMRDARAFTGRELIIRFAGHFHGWHDYAMAGYQPPFDTSTSTGVPKAVTGTMLVAYPNNIESVRQLLNAHPDQVAAVILEPGGGSNGIIPTNVGFLHELRALTAERGVVLIFDEVITGFRYSPGGAQQVYGVLALTGVELACTSHRHSVQIPDSNFRLPAPPQQQRRRSTRLINHQRGLVLFRPHHQLAQRRFIVDYSGLVDHLPGAIHRKGVVPTLANIHAKEGPRVHHHPVFCLEIGPVVSRSHPRYTRPLYMLLSRDRSTPGALGSNTRYLPRPPSSFRV